MRLEHPGQGTVPWVRSHREHQNTEPRWITKAQGRTELLLWVRKPGLGNRETPLPEGA